MKAVVPIVRLFASPQVDWDAIRAYLESVGGMEWYDRVTEQEIGDAEALIEFAGRLCYRSWSPGLNPNVTKVREDSDEYLGNILKSLHGSVTEHAWFSFIFQDVSRVFTHEFVRHRAGTAFSQESMRYVRLTDIPFWFPPWCLEDEELFDRCVALLKDMEEHQTWMAEHFALDATKLCMSCFQGFTDEANTMVCVNCQGTGRIPAVPFSEKKAKTSFMRRFAPDGVATAIVGSINIRAVRWIIQQRTEIGAEEEIRRVFDQVAFIMKERAPALMQDFERSDEGVWVPTYRKV